MTAKEEIEIIFSRPRKESDSLVLTIPKHVCDKLKISIGSRLDLVVYNSFVVLKQREPIDYEREPAPKIFELLDTVFDAFRELKKLERQRYYEGTLTPSEYDAQVEKIHKMLRNTGSKILSLLKEKKRMPASLQFDGEFQNANEVLDILRNVYDEHYKDEPIET